MTTNSTPDFEFLWQYVDYWANIDPAFPIIHFENSVISSSELSWQSKKLAEALLSLGLKKGDRIITVLPPRPEYVLLLVAANQIGVILVPMDIRYRHTDFQRLIPLIEPKLIISLSGDKNIDYQLIFQGLIKKENSLSDVLLVYLGETDQGLNFYDFFDSDYTLEKEIQEIKKSQSKFDDFLIIWTGGTTGFPKAAIITNNNYVRMCVLEHKVLIDYLHLRGVSKTPKYLANLTVSHVGGSVELLGVGMIGGYQIIIQERWSSTKTLETIEKEKIQVLLASPTMYRIMIAHEKFENYNLSSLKLVIISGEIVNQEFINLMKSKICKTIINGYGSTEMGPEITFTHPDDDYSKIASGYVGRPLPGVEIQITDYNDNILEIGMVGEVIVKGELVCKGYFRNPEENDKSFTKEGWFKTGDLGKLDENQGLWLEGRIKDVIRVGSYTVLPMEIEELVLDYFNLELAVVISVSDDILGEVVWLVIATSEGENITEEEVIHLCKQELANYKVPKKVIFYELDQKKPPITRIGKIDRNRLRKEILNL